MIASREINTIPELNTAAEALAKETRARMIPFRHFFRMGDGYSFSSLQNAKDTIRYIEEFWEYTHLANVRVGECLAKHLADFLNNGRLSISITEYSRTVFSGLQRLADRQEQIDINFVERPGKALVPEEAPRSPGATKGSRVPENRTVDTQRLANLLRTASRRKRSSILFSLARKRSLRTAA